MISVGSKLRIVDNSGAKIVSCISLNGGYRKRSAGIGSIILVSVKSLKAKRRSKAKIEKGSISRCVIVSTRFMSANKSGMTSGYTTNSGVLLNRQNRPIGSRCSGGLPRSLRSSRVMRVSSLGLGLIK